MTSERFIEKEKKESFRTQTHRSTLLNIEPYQFHEYRTDKKYNGFKILIDETKGDKIPITLWEITRYLPTDMKFYTKIFKKDTGSNPGWICLIHFEITNKAMKTEILPQWILCKKSHKAQDISEILMQSIINELIAKDICASPFLCVDEPSKEVYVISVMYPGFQDSWKNFFSKHNEYLLKLKMKTKTIPKDRPRSVGFLNKYIQNGIAQPIIDQPECMPYLNDFYYCMALSFFIRNYDFHFSNLGCIFRIANSEILRETEKINILLNFIKQQNDALIENDIEKYERVTIEFEEYKKVHHITEHLVLIDCGWAGAHWQQHIINTLRGDIGFEGNSWKLHLPLFEPTNHFDELAKNIKYTELFAQALVTISNKFNSNHLAELIPFLRRTLDFLEKYYGEKGLKEYAQYIGLSFKTDFIKEEIIFFLVDRAFPTEQLAATKLALMIRVSLCFNEKGNWTATSSGYQWNGQARFKFNIKNFKKLVKTYDNDEDNPLKNIDENYFIGVGQEKYRKELLEAFLIKYTQYKCRARYDAMSFKALRRKNSETAENKENFSWIARPRY